MYDNVCLTPPCTYENIDSLTWRDLSVSLPSSLPPSPCLPPPPSPPLLSLSFSAHARTCAPVLILAAQVLTADKLK